MTPVLNTGNSTRLTESPSALCVSRLSDELTLSDDPMAQFTATSNEIANTTIPKSRVSKNKLPRCPGSTMAANKLLRNVRKLNENSFTIPLLKTYSPLNN